MQNLSPNQVWEAGQMEHPIANPEVLKQLHIKKIILIQILQT